MVYVSKTPEIIQELTYIKNHAYVFWFYNSSPQTIRFTEFVLKEELNEYPHSTWTIKRLRSRLILIYNAFSFNEAMRERLLMAWRRKGQRQQQLICSNLVEMACRLGSASRDHFVYAPRQWETTLQRNGVSHWLGAYTKWSLCKWTVKSL